MAQAQLPHSTILSPERDFSMKQMLAFVTPLRRLTILDGAVRSGKTVVSIYMWINYVIERTRPEDKLLMVGVTEDTLYINVIDDLLKYTEGYSHYNRGTGILTLFGRKIICRGAPDVKADSRIRGMTAAGAYVDEVTKIPEEVFKQIMARCSRDPGCILVTTNPDTPFHWFYEPYLHNEKMIKAGRLYHLHFIMSDNPGLSKEYIDDMRMSLTGVWYQRNFLGRWVIAEGLVYAGWNPKVHGFTSDQQPATFSAYYLSIDFGIQNAFACGLYGRLGNRLYLIDEYHHSGAETGRQKRIGEYKDDIIQFVNANGLHLKAIQKVFIDPSALAMHLELKSAGFNMALADNKVLDGIQIVAQMLARGDLKVNLKCENIRKEFTLYSWDKEASKKTGIDVVVKQNDHQMDQIRYICYSLFGKQRSGIA